MWPAMLRTHCLSNLHLARVQVGCRRTARCEPCGIECEHPDALLRSQVQLVVGLTQTKELHDRLPVVDRRADDAALVADDLPCDRGGLGRAPSTSRTKTPSPLFSTRSPDRLGPVEMSVNEGGSARDDLVVDLTIEDWLSVVATRACPCADRRLNSTRR
jgi:hypothetical protein